MRRRLASGLIVCLLLAPAAAGLTGCGSGNGQLKVTLSSPDRPGYKVSDAKTYAAYSPGDQAQFSVSVVNAGPGSVSGVTVHVLLPTGFRYHSTQSVDAPGSTRTQPLDAAVNSNTPIFGLWDISAPGSAGTDVNGKALPVGVTITFFADVQGKPGTVSVQAFAAGDATSGQTEAAPYLVTVNAAAHLNALATVSPSTAKAGATVTYQVRITNDGTDNASDVSLLVTLPPVLTFSSSVMPFAGNGTRNGGVNPFKNTLLVYYDGFLLPPDSNAGPGYVVVVFKATVVAAPVAGAYPVDVSVTDDQGATATLHAVAPVMVTAAPTAGPTASPAATPTATATPH